MVQDVLLVLSWTLLSDSDHSIAENVVEFMPDSLIWGNLKMVSRMPERFSRCPQIYAVSVILESVPDILY